MYLVNRHRNLKDIHWFFLALLLALSGFSIAAIGMVLPKFLDLYFSAITEYDNLVGLLISKTFWAATFTLFILVAPAYFMGLIFRSCDKELLKRFSSETRKT